MTALLTSALLAGCSARTPVLHPDAHAKQVGEAQQRRDIDECKKLADSIIAGAPDVAGGARSTVTGGAIGAASGAAGGAIYGNAGQGAAAGAAGGAVAGLFGWLLRPRQPDPTYVSIVNQCLSDRGYRVAGWR